MAEAEVLPLGTGSVATESVRVPHLLSAHSHEFVEIGLVMHGHGVHHTQAGPAMVRPGTLVVAPADSWHAWAPVEPIELQNLYLSERFVAAELGWLHVLPGIGAFLRRSEAAPGLPALTVDLAPRARSDVQAALQRIAEIGAAVDLSSRLTTTARVLDFFAAVAPLFDPRAGTGALAQGPPVASVSPPAVGHRDSVIRAMAALHEQVDADWTLERLAAEVRLSPSQLTRVFASDTGTSPIAYLNRVRVERMAYLLRTTDLPVSAVGRMIGWGDPSYATRRFKRHFGATPATYRARLR